MNEITLIIDYKAHGRDLKEELQKHLSTEYTTIIRPKGGPAAGGIYDASVEIIFNLDLKDFVMIAVGGLAWDLIKAGTRKFMLEPLVDAFAGLEGQSEGAIDFSSTVMRFQDTDIFLYGMEDVFTVVIPRIFPLIVKNYDAICGSEGSPEAIIIPLQFDEEAGRYIDEGFGNSYAIEDYTRFWGVSYDIFGEERKVFDVGASVYLDAFVESEY
jgi:hypothetical protein